jgi:hypothetical protein
VLAKSTQKCQIQSRLGKYCWLAEKTDHWLGNMTNVCAQGMYLCKSLTEIEICLRRLKKQQKMCRRRRRSGLIFQVTVFDL